MPFLFCRIWAKHLFTAKHILSVITCTKSRIKCVLRYSTWSLAVITCTKLHVYVNNLVLDKKSIFVCAFVQWFPIHVYDRLPSDVIVECAARWFRFTPWERSLASCQEQCMHVGWRSSYSTQYTLPRIHYCIQWKCNSISVVYIHNR